MPLLVMMAITGGVYLFKNEIDRYVYRDWQQVKVRPQTPLPMSEAIARVEAYMHGRVLQLTLSTNENDAIKMIVRVHSGESRTAYVDPYEGRVLGSTEYGGVMQVIRKVHSLQRFGFWASCLIEITAGWTIVMVMMGIYLWWPRQQGGVVSIRGRPTSRMFWRDVHAVTGVFTALIILFLALTGMPWSMFWGNHVQAWASARGLGQPAAPANVVPDWQIGQSVKPASVANEHVHNALPWALEQTQAPVSFASARQPIGVDHALHLVKQQGMRSAFTLTLPADPAGVYMAAYRPNRTEDTRVLYLDQYTGAVLGDVGYAQYGSVSKAIEWGIAVHQGTEYGAVNRYVMLAGCVAIVLLAMSSLVMWLKRKPGSSFAVRQRPDSPRALRYVLIGVAATGVVFPLVGVSLVVALLVERVTETIRSRLTLTRT